jgi:hypothetical protein
VYARDSGRSPMVRRGSTSHLPRPLRSIAGKAHGIRRTFRSVRHMGNRSSRADPARGSQTPRPHPQIPATTRAQGPLIPQIPACPRSARKRHDRPVTPVAGSSPVAPVKSPEHLLLCWRVRRRLWPTALFSAAAYSAPRACRDARERMRQDLSDCGLKAPCSGSAAPGRCRPSSSGCSWPTPSAATSKSSLATGRVRRSQA